MRPTSSFAIALIAALALAGCGRRGPLELPPGAPVQPSGQNAAAQDRVLDNEDNPGLVQNPNKKFAAAPVLKPTDIISEGQVPRPINAPPQPKTGFFLDPLL